MGRKEDIETIKIILPKLNSSNIESLLRRVQAMIE